jgi:hypothetical protein
VVISDSNRHNPVMLAVMLRLRCKGLSVSRTTLHGSGRAVPMAEERLFTPGSIERRLASMGLCVKRRVLGGFAPPLVGAHPSVMRRLDRLEDLCQRTPGLAHLCGIYTLLAGKPPGSVHPCAA